MEERLIDSSFRQEDYEEVGLRPRSFDEYVGQDIVKARSRLRKT